MALADFWNGVRKGLALFVPSRVVEDSQRLDIERIQAILDQADVWLTPDTVRGYDPEDFSFLSEESRSELTRLVKEFSRIAGTVGPRRPADPLKVAEAKPLFRDIVHLLEFDRFADPEAFRIGKTIEADSDFPSLDVVDVRYRSTTDSLGEQALKIMAYLPDSEEEEFLDRALLVRKAIQELVFRHGRPYWPYVSVRLASDLADLPAVGADE